MYKFLRPLLFLLPAETAHHLTLNMFSLLSRLNFIKPSSRTKNTQTKNLMGLDFPNPVGLAAGLDKNGEHIDALAALGFGFIEIGTVTPRPQPGNPKPRMFRIPKAQGIINRMGFNNHGVDYLVEKVKQAKFKGILGINIGKNFDTPIEKASEDYLICMKKVYPYASYITVNISSPNTPGLRDLQHDKELISLLSALKKEQEKLSTEYKKYVPLLVKIAPDLNDDEIKNIATIIMNEKMDGVISSNTTLSKEDVSELPNGNEKGGLSGKPLFEKSLHNINILNEVIKSEIPIIACGGIMEGKNAAQMIAAGASLVQIYTGLIYQGPKLITECINL